MHGAGETTFLGRIRSWTLRVWIMHHEGKARPYSVREIPARVQPSDTLHLRQDHDFVPYMCASPHALKITTKTIVLLVRAIRPNCRKRRRQVVL